MAKPPDEPTLGDIDAVLHFLPLVEQSDFEPGVVHAAETLPDGTAQPARFEASPPLIELLDTLHRHHWISSFDWAEWQTVADRYVKEPALLAGAGVGTLRKLFTTHVQKDQFSPGHLLHVVEAGHLRALMHRLQQVRDGAPSQT